MEAHGSFASQGCIDCKAPFDAAEIKRLIQEEKIPRCARCRGLVKPDIVFFGEAVSVLLPFIPFILFRDVAPIPVLTLFKYFLVLMM